MKAISGKEFAKRLEQAGWTLLRIQGSHYIYGKSVARFVCLYQFMVIKL